MLSGRLKTPACSECRARHAFASPSHRPVYQQPCTRHRQISIPAARREVLLLGIAAGLALKDVVFDQARAQTEAGAPSAATAVPSPAPEAAASPTRPPQAAPEQPQASTSSHKAVYDAPAALPQSSPPNVTAAPKDSITLSEEAAKKLLEEEDERRKQRKRKKGRIRELEEIRSELAEKELILLEKEKELLEKDQTLIVLKEELDLERKLRALLTKEKEKAEEEAALAMGLCTGGAMLP